MMTDRNNAYPPASYIRERFDGFERDVKGLTAHIQRLETDLRERITAVDCARVRGDDSMHDLVTRTANAIYAEVKKLEQRISDCELAVGTNKLTNAQEPQANDFEMVWHPYKVGDAHPDGDEQVVVMLKNGHVSEPGRAMYCDWDRISKHTIVAWRRKYAEDDA